MRYWLHARAHYGTVSIIIKLGGVRGNMKKVIKVFGVLVLGLSLFGGAASAQSCTITNTGPGSTNTCTYDNNVTLTFRCENGVVVDVQTNQGASSGGSNNSGNTNGGGASSGNASNTNNTNITVGQSCDEAQRAAQPTQPGDSANGQAGPGQDSVASLPETGTATTVMIATVLVAGLAAFGLLAQFGLARFRR